MKKLAKSMRIVACGIWIAGGVAAGGTMGYLGAFSSTLFLVAIFLD